MMAKRRISFTTRLRIKKGLLKYNIGVKTGRIRKPALYRKDVE